MFLRSKIQEMILRRRSRSMNNTTGAHRSHAPDQLAISSTAPCDGDGAGAGSKSATARALFASPRLLHSSSLPTGTVVLSKSPATPDAGESETTAFSMSPTSVLDAASFRSGGGSDAVGNSKRRPWRDNALHGLAGALDCNDQQQQQQEGIVLAATSPSLLIRSCSLDRRVEFGVKNKSSWLPLRACSGREDASSPALAAEDPWEMEPSSEDYTCVISRGPNPRTVHIFGDRVVEADDAESSPRPINLPACGDRGFLSL
ncbi:hypothetical protein HU200_004447 [Digitaria exilis]|uniref:Uncharacterized protein n=1 Tax=Digitaria exilis TaxID=1010633 RepID=A0A835FSH1_9POAL|nr:hypothetical protein HU200_004447 [Digitaria exilis]